MDDQRRANSSSVRIPLVPLQRSIGDLSPSGRIMRERSSAANVIQPRETDLGGLLLIDHMLSEIKRASGTTFTACTIVGQENDQRVFQAAERMEKIDQPADLRIRVFEKSRIGFLEPRRKDADVGRKVAPRRDVWVERSQARLRRHDTKRPLFLQAFGSHGIPT